MVLQEPNSDTIEKPKVDLLNVEFLFISYLRILDFPEMVFFPFTNLIQLEIYLDFLLFPPAS